MNDETTLTDEQKADLAEQERQAKLWVRVQAEEAERRQTEDAWKNLGNLSEAEFRAFKRKQGLA